MKAPVLFALLCAALLLPLAAPSAHADEPATGGTTITLDGSAAKALKRAGVRFVAVEPAVATRRTLTLPVASARVGNLTRAFHTGVVQLVRGKGSRARRVAVTGARTRLSGRSLTTARLGTRRVTLLRYGRVRPERDAATGTVRLTAPVMLAEGAVRVLHKRLRLGRFTARRLGTARVAIVRRAALPPVVAPPAPGPVPSPPTSPAAPPGTAPAAGTVTSASFTWRPRESFVRYINGGEGTAASDGAQDGPKEVRPGSSAPLVYAFAFPFASGTSGGGQTLLSQIGKVTFSFQAHGIDLSFASPRLSFGPTASASFVFGGATAGAKAGTLVRALDLNLAGAASHTIDGATESYVDAPATLTQEGSEAFSGFYAPGEPFGTVSATWTRTP